MRAAVLMVQGTASHAGKSIITAALCRWLAREGRRVAPFKAQNMSLNSAVTADGREIGRSQAFQAAGCGVEPEAAMNPMLLKPLSEGRCQVIVLGKPYGIVEGYGDSKQRETALQIATEALDDLRERFDVVVMEGMGSPAEINLRERDVANMAMAASVDAPVLLVGDIERGGVFASLAGTLELLLPEERSRVKGLLINKFHGDPAVLAPGLRELERRYGVPTVAVLPWLRDLRVDEEDAVGLPDAGRSDTGADIDIVVPRLPAIANFTDFAPLEAETGARVRYVDRPSDWGCPRLVVLPGSRSVAADLAWLRGRGLAEKVVAHAAAGGLTLGVCGGYQMLGREIRDPEHVESEVEAVPGLGLLDVVTTFAPAKVLTRAEGTSLIRGWEGLPVVGYEIHHGTTVLGSEARPAFQLARRLGSTFEATDGAVNPAGTVMGTYLHGVFDGAELRRALFDRLGVPAPPGRGEVNVFDRLADWWQENADTGFVDGLLRAQTRGA